MVVGFNHNFRYNGEIYHVQTEDGGVKSASIITLLYRGGTILASKKTSYADILKVDKLPKVVEELMKEQHKEMLRRLKAGDFDQVIAKFLKAVESHQAPPPPESETAQADFSGTDSGVCVHAVDAPSQASPAMPVTPVVPAVAAAVAASQDSAPIAADSEQIRSLDDIILSYLLGEVE